MIETIEQTIKIFIKQFDDISPERKNLLNDNAIYTLWIY